MPEVVDVLATFGERIRQLRLAKGKSQTEAAKEMGLTRGALSLYELDQRSPDKETLAVMARYYHTSTDYLLGLTDDPRPVDEAKQDDPAPTLEDLRRMAKMIEASGGHIDAAMARVIREILEAANRGKDLASQGDDGDDQRQAQDQ